jgi:hypothetical protein
LEDNIEKINWSMLSVNSSAIHLLELYPEKIHWSMLSENLNLLDLFNNKPPVMK